MQKIGGEREKRKHRMMDRAEIHHCKEESKEGEVCGCGKRVEVERRARQKERKDEG